jgi:hypothetical protein
LAATEYASYRPMPMPQLDGDLAARHLSDKPCTLQSSYGVS